jgi:hypothetical protein
VKKRACPRRTVVGVATSLVTFALGVTLAVAVAGSASASSSLPTLTTPTSSTSTSTTSTASTSTTSSSAGFDPNSPAATFSVINGTVSAASDHEIVGSSAFPNFTTGAVDNYYSMARSHVDNSPFAEGTASPADTGPAGQTAAAGNFQQPQYADARWPGGPDSATYGNQGGPYAAADAGDYRATADSSEGTNGASGPGISAPQGFDSRLRQALAAWKATWLDRLTPASPTPKTTTPEIPKIPKTVIPTSTVPLPKARTTAPAATVPAPIGTITTPSVSPVPPATVPSPALPAPAAVGPGRSLESASTPGDGESLLSSSAHTSLDPKGDGSKGYSLVTSGESSLGRAVLGGGQIVVHGIHVTASIVNDGTPSYKAAVSVGAASIGGIPVTIDQDGVHVSGQGQGLPYQQASDALNGALKQAGIELFLVGPEVTTNSCGGSGTGTGTGGTDTTTTSSDTTTTPSDQSGSASSCDQLGGSCSPAGAGPSGGTGGGPALGTTTTTTTTTTSGDQPDATSSCGQGGSGCDQSATGTTSTDTNTTSTMTSTDQSGGGSSAPSWCNLLSTPAGTSSCTPAAGTTTGTTTSTDQSTTTTTTDTTGSGGQTGTDGGAPSSAEETVTATGLHVVFTQPVSPPGVPAQYVQHILGEVYVDSLAVPAPPLPDLGLSTGGGSSCLGGGHGHRSKTAGGASAAGGGGSATGGSAATGGGSSTAGGSASSGSLAPSGSSLTSSSQPGSSSGGRSLPAELASALRKPLWLLLAYLAWQALVVATGVSLWGWRREGAA